MSYQRGDLNSQWSTAFAPMCVHLQLFQSDFLTDHFAGQCDDAALSVNIYTYLGRYYNITDGLTKIVTQALDAANWDLCKALFRRPNMLSMLSKKHGTHLVFHPIEISEEPLSSFNDPPDPEEIFPAEGPAAGSADPEFQGGTPSTPPNRL